MAKNKIYAVRAGRKPGIYTAWAGENGAQAQVAGFPNAVYKGFENQAAAERWLHGLPDDDTPGYQMHLQAGKVVIYTDGGSLGNPGPGGYGVVLLFANARKELSGGFRRTTNNRMELTAAIKGLEALTRPSQVVLYTDSSYLANGLSKGWARRWQKNGWMRGKDQPAENADLWEQLLALDGRHQIQVDWLRGHAGDPNNERCDQLAKEAAARPNLSPDPGFEDA